MFIVIINGCGHELQALHYLLTTFAVDAIVHEEGYTSRDASIQCLVGMVQMLGLTTPVYESKHAPKFKGAVKDTHAQRALWASASVPAVPDSSLIDWTGADVMSFGAGHTLAWVLPKIRSFNAFLGENVVITSSSGLDPWMKLSQDPKGRCWARYQVSQSMLMEATKYKVRNNMRLIDTNFRSYSLALVLQLFRI